MIVVKKSKDSLSFFFYKKILDLHQGFLETILCSFWFFLGLSDSLCMDNKFLEDRVSCFFEENLGNSAGRLSAFFNPLFSCFAVYFTCVCMGIKPTKNAFETFVCRSTVFCQNNSKKCFLVSTSSGKSNFEHTTKEWIKKEEYISWRLLFKFSAFGKEYSFFEFWIIFHHFHFLSLCHLVFGSEVAVTWLTSELDDDSVVFFCHLNQINK